MPRAITRCYLPSGRGDRHSRAPAQCILCVVVSSCRLLQGECGRRVLGNGRRLRGGRRLRWFEAAAHGIHQLSAGRAREGVPLQSLSVSAATHRDGVGAPADRATDQNLVPEPTNEVEEGPEARSGGSDDRRSWGRLAG